MWALELTHQSGAVLQVCGDEREMNHVYSKVVDDRNITAIGLQPCTATVPARGPLARRLPLPPAESGQREIAQELRAATDDVVRRADDLRHLAWAGPEHHHRAYRAVEHARGALESNPDLPLPVLLQDLEPILDELWPYGDTDGVTGAVDRLRTVAATAARWLNARRYQEMREEGGR
jgi:hypothetical protein